MVSYNLLWKTLIDRHKKKTDLIAEVGISSATLAKLSKNEYVSMETIVKICNWLHCTISDICVIVDAKHEVCL